MLDQKEKQRLPGAEKYFLILFCMFIALIPTELNAGDTAEIVYAEGKGFSLVRKGESQYFDIYQAAVEGLELLGGDLILTDAGSWLEIQLAGSGTVIKIAENTTFTIKTLQDEGGTFKVSYGRVRARVEKHSSQTPFWIEGSDTVAGVRGRGADFGYDLLFDPGAPEKKTVAVYCFKGTVKVVRQLELLEDEKFIADPDFTKGKEKTSTVILRKNEMVSVVSEDKTAALEKRRIKPEVKDFWERNDFIFDPLEEIDHNGFQDFHNDGIQLRQGALISSITGALMAGGGASAYYFTDNQDVGMGLMTVGSSLIAAGGYFLIRSFLIQ